MNKKGFTLIEIIVSIVLVSIVMISLLGSLIQLRSTYTVIHENSDVIVYSSSITRVINNDLALNNGIRYVSCEATSGQECDMILGNDSNRKLQIIRKCSVSICGANGGSCTPNTEINCDEMNAADTQEGIKHTNIKTTLKYIDTTDASNSELLYIRTLESDRYENVVKSGTGNYFKTKSVTTKGYNFQNMSATVYEFSQDGTSDSLIDQYTTILIKLNNLENEDLSKYDITLYTAGRYDWSNLIGSRYRLQLNNDGAEIPGTTQIDEIFGVGYFTAGMSDVGSQIKKIDIPKKSTQAFLG